MDTKQINLKISEGLLKAAEQYAELYGYRNVQELAAESIREKVFEDNEYDETFSEKEIELVDSLIKTAVKKKLLVTEEELNKTLLK